jgi:solute carrier family 15 oligopeptide transporter 1
MVGSFLFALGAGSLRPCINAFGGDQFILPKQDKQLNSFYTYFYIATNAGMLTTGFILPVLR